MTLRDVALDPGRGAPGPHEPAARTVWHWAAWVTCAAAFVLFATYRSRFVGGCDPSSYYLESLRFRGIDALHLDPSLPHQAALAPLCMELRAGRVVSFFPPGFPLLLAGFGAAGLELYVTALAGALSGIALFHLALPSCGARLAFAVTALWLTSPLVLFGSTQLMSDAPATALGLLALLVARSGRSALAGGVLGFSLGVRPTQLFLLPLLVLEAKALRPRVQLLAGLTASLAGWAAFLRLSTGSFVPPYAANATELSGELLLAQLRFLAGTTAFLHLPVALLALVGLALRFTAVWPLLVGLLAYTGFYSLWRSPLTQWWECRFLLPVLPALYLAAAEGWSGLEARAARGRPAILWALGLTLVVGYGAWSFALSPARDARTTHYAEDYALDSLRVAQLVPRGALVGAVNHSGPLRLYGRVQSFLAWHDEAPALVRFALGSGRPLFVVLTDEERRAASTRVSLPPARFEPIETLPSGRILQRALPLENVVDAGAPKAREVLRDGFTGNEGSPSMTFAWVVGRHATIEPLPVAGEGGLLVSLHVEPFAGLSAAQGLVVSAGGERLESFPLERGYQTFHVRVPAHLAAVPLVLDFAVAQSPASLGQGEDRRPLAAALDWIAFSPLP